MKHYIIDGNNLIGKISSLQKIQQKDKQSSREKLAFMMDNYFHNKKAKCTIHFDGFAQQPIKITYSKIIYSNNQTADNEIKKQIEMSKNRKNLVVVTSDNNLSEFAHVCSCTVMKSEEFANTLQRKVVDDEKNRIELMSKDEDEFKKLFGVDDE